jgi:hypothetical protein
MSDILELSKFEEQIYNIHLRSARTRKSLPYKFRKDFSSLDDKTRSTLKKIANFLRRHSHINLEEFISAPYKIYKDEEFFNLEYYATLKAVKAYTLYHNSMLYENPDNEEQLQNIVKSLKYIQEFCKANNIALTDYLKHMSDKLPSFFIHLKEHHVSLYTLLGFNNFAKEFRSIDIETAKFILGEEFINRIEVCKTKLFSSEKAMKVITLGLQRVEEHLK